MFKTKYGKLCKYIKGYIAEFKYYGFESIWIKMWGIKF